MPTSAASAAILQLFQGEREYRTMELLDALRQTGLSEGDIKEAVAYLIRDHQIEMTADRRLKAPDHNAVHA